MRLIDRRAGLLFSVFLLAFSVATVRAVWLQGVRGGEYRADARGQQTEVLRVPAHRGRLLDRNGKELAVSEDAVTVFATPNQVPDPVATAAKLAPLLDVEQNDLVDQLSNRTRGFAFLKRKAAVSEAKAVEALEMPGIGFLPDVRRSYPQGAMAGQVIGAVGLDDQGLTGLEMHHDEILRGADGKRKVVKDALGGPLGIEAVVEERPGKDLTLTLDADIQAHTESVLAGIGSSFRPAGATAIVMDPRDGSILAMANWPRLDPNKIAAADPEAMRNRAIGFNYEPGSTFKAFTVAAALEESLVTPATPFGLPPTIQVADRKIGEAHDRGAVTLTVAQILAQSSNVGAVKVGLLTGQRKLYEWIRKFGFGGSTGVDFPGEEQGIVPAPEAWSGSTIGNVPIGQGLSVTAIQMATAYSAIANGGSLPRPHLVQRRDGQDVAPGPVRQVLSERTARQLRQMLKGVLAPGGTASEVSVPGYELAGKTGTAEKVIDGAYSKTKFVASFVGFAPAERPQLLVAVSVDEPQGSYYGGTVAAPAFGEIATFALPHLGISPR